MKQVDPGIVVLHNLQCNEYGGSYGQLSGLCISRGTLNNCELCETPSLSFVNINFTVCESTSVPNSMCRDFTNCISDIRQYGLESHRIVDLILQSFYLSEEYN